MLSKLRESILDRRDACLGNPRFHAAVLRSPLTRWIARRRARELFDIAAGFSYSRVLTACVDLKLFELLAEGARGTDELASRLDIAREGLVHLLEAAAELRLLRALSGDRWRLGELGAASLGSPGIAAMVSHNTALYRDLLDPLALLRDRSSSAVGRYWHYAARPGRSEAANARRYSELMARSQSFIADDVLSNCPLAGRCRLLDIGGGSGVFAARAVQRFARLRATVFDLPDVAALAEARFAALALRARAQVQGGDMFSDPLPEGADVISLLRVLHDHNDDKVRILLRAIRRAIRADGLLVVAEPMAGTRGAPGVGAYFQLYLWAMGSGRPRSARRLKQLLEEAGFAAVTERRSYQPLLVRILTARPAQGMSR